jgi:hypothetical protein
MHAAHVPVSIRPGLRSPTKRQLPNPFEHFQIEPNGVSAGTTTVRIRDT